MPFRLIGNNILPNSCPNKYQKDEFLLKFIGKERFSTIEHNVTRWAEEKGIPISLRGIMTQSTRAHRLALKARKIGGQRLQTPLVSAIFKATNQDGKDISDFDVLAELAEESGVMGKADTIEFLKSDELEKEVNDLCNAARSKGITGVPITIIDEKWAVSGGQSSDVYIQIFKKLAAAGVHAAPSPFPSSLVHTCTGDGSDDSD
ncbi:thioredoxin-like protein [Coprinopsis marcescibilis]|uniref:Thioredoxin-like protein n=1 Tax=Coprinopsis marcescibilis TaxID=230819 RepID=A0A5C3L5Z6_COPMA|nr:thioredoxin-like protein [Coprinopsis marcescibilis]